MRRILWWSLSTLSAVVLLFGYRTSTGGGTVGPPASTQTTTGSFSAQLRTGSTSPSSAAPPASATSPTPAPTTSGSSGTSKRVAGNTAQTRWGPVQVQITVAGSKITDVAVLQYPQGNGRDIEINDYALPRLTQETIDAQSARIDMISGATVTSDGYLQSLQSALDKAGL